jgi:hypothetical protein
MQELVKTCQDLEYMSGINKSYEAAKIRAGMSRLGSRRGKDRIFNANFQSISRVVDRGNVLEWRFDPASMR